MRNRKIRVDASPLTILYLNSIHFCHDEVLYCKFALPNRECLFQKQGFNSYDSCVLTNEEAMEEEKRLYGKWPYNPPNEVLDFIYGLRHFRGNKFEEDEK